MRAVWIVVLLYVLGFVAFRPAAAMIVDEAEYVQRDGVAFLVIIERADSGYHRRHRDMQEAWWSEAARWCVFDGLHDHEHGPVHLRILRTKGCRSNPD